VSPKTTPLTELTILSPHTPDPLATDVLLIGAGGHARVVLDILRTHPALTPVGVIDPAPRGEALMGVPVLGGDERLPELLAQGTMTAIIAIGSTGDCRLRERLFTECLADGWAFATAVHRSAIVAPDAAIGQGTAIMAGAIVNTGTSVGQNVVINTGAVVEHDCVIGDHAYVSPGAVLCGGVYIGVGAFIGAGATVRQGVRIGDWTVVGAGAVVLEDLPPEVTAFGVPARVVIGR
jgi:UDP-perosamine 4-acetyltransferase